MNKAAVASQKIGCGSSTWYLSKDRANDRDQSTKSGILSTQHGEMINRYGVYV